MIKPETIDSTTELLIEREITHGDFTEVAKFAQAYRELFQSHPGWQHLPPHAREAISMKASKMARIMCGAPDFPDHWNDDAGYSRLVADRCRRP